MPPIMIIHVVTGTAGFLSGAMALAARKGATLHRRAGDVFVVSMLIMAGSAAAIAWQEGKYSMVAGGLFTAYLVATAWATVMRREGTIGLFERLAILAAVGCAAFDLYLGLPLSQGHGRRDEPPLPAFFVLSAVALVAAAFDLTVVPRHGITGAARIARHLWRMCFAFFIATGSFFTNGLPRPFTPLSFPGTPWGPSLSSA